MGAKPFRPSVDRINEEYEKMWETELDEWAKILEGLEDESFEVVYSSLHLNKNLHLIQDIISKSPKLKKRLLGVMV